MNITNQYKLIIALALLAIVGWSCEENEDFLPFEQAESDITFEGYPAYGADFSLLDNVVIPVSAPGASEIQVIREISYSANDVTQNINETLTTLSGPDATLQVSIADIVANPDNVEAANVGSTDLLFQVSVNGQTSYRRFSLDFYNPLSVDAPEETFNDSTIRVKYEVDLVNASLSEVEVFFRDTKDGEFSSTPLETFTTSEDSLDIVVPSEAVVAPGGDIGLRFVATTADGISATQTLSIDALSIPLADPVDLALEADGNAIDFSAGDTVATGGDLAVSVVGSQLQLEALGGSDFILVEEGFDFAGASFQDVRDAYTEGTPQSVVGNLSNVATGQVLIVRLADATAGSADEYALVQLGELIRGFDVEDSQLSVQYRVR